MEQVHCSSERTDEVEQYVMLSTTKDNKKDSEYQDKTFIVKRIDLSFNDKECQVMNFIDITVQKRLNQV